MKVLFLFRGSEWLGIEYLSSLLKQARHSTELVYDPGMGDQGIHIGHLERLSREKIRRNMMSKAERFGPDLIAFSCLTNLYPWVDEMARVYKERFKVPVIVGGMHPTFFPEIVISNPHIDIICRGEGEHAMTELVNAMERKEDYTSIKNLWVKKDGAVIRNPLRTLIADLDSLPLPDKDLFYQYRCFSDRAFVLTSRGCPYDCSYCFNHSMKDLYKGNGTYIRRRKPENVIQELLLYKEKYGTKEIFFYDDIFTLDIKWLRQFVPLYKKEIGLPFKCMVRANCLSQEIVALLKEAGSICADIGLESGSKRIRSEVMNRHMSQEQILAACGLLKNAGIRFNTLNIFGSPGEVPADMDETVALNRAIRPNGALATVLYPFPGTKIAEIAEQCNCLNAEAKARLEKGISSYTSASLLDHPYQKEILQYQIFMPVAIKCPKFMEKFLLSLPPWKIFRFGSIFFNTDPHSLFCRIKELLHSLWYSLFKQS
jgi:radical SAM superfamily enzyme YgiQ (UPF0313 family)